MLRGAIKSRAPKEQRTSAPPLCSFAHGVATLPRALAAKLGDSLQYETRAVSATFSAQPSAGGAAREIRVVRNGQELSAHAGAVVMATPAYAAAHVLESFSPPLAQTLSGIAYAPVAVVASSYYRQQVGDPLEGFGFLVPRGEKVRTLGTVWNSSLFPGRAHEGSVTITSFIGGATDPDVIRLHEENIAAIVTEENARILGITGPPVEVAVWKYPRALPQYNLGHGHIVESIRDAERASPGLFFAGNYLEGPAIGKCVETGFQTAEAVGKYLQSAR